MRTVNVHEAKTHLSRLLEAVEAGEEVLIARAGKPVARLAPLRPGKRRLGALEGRFEVPSNWDEPLADDVLAAFTDGPIEPRHGEQGRR
jgi:prevent-host-death family protein